MILSGNILQVGNEMDDQGKEAGHDRGEAPGQEDVCQGFFADGVGAFDNADPKDASDNGLGG